MVVSGIGTLAVLLALATTANAAGSPGRYSMTPSGEGFLRMDTETGAVSLCKDQDGAFVCKAVADDAAAMTAEIDRLAKENEQLRGGNSSPGALAAVPPGRDDSLADNKNLKLPSDKEIDQAMGFIEKMLRRFKTLMDDLKSQPDTHSL